MAVYETESNSAVFQVVEWICNLGFLLKFPFHISRLTLKIEQETKTHDGMNHGLRDSLKKFSVLSLYMSYSSVRPNSPLMWFSVSVVTHAAESMGALWASSGTGESVTPS